MRWMQSNGIHRTNNFLRDAFIAVLHSNSFWRKNQAKHGNLGQRENVMCSDLMLIGNGGS